MVREFFAETLGIFLLVSFGLASVAQNVLFTQKDTSTYSFLSVNLAFGFGATAAAIVSGSVSGKFKSKIV